MAQILPPAGRPGYTEFPPSKFPGTHMSLLGRPIGALALALLLATAAVWGEYDWLRASSAHADHSQALMLLVAGWLGLLVMVGSIYRRMLSDRRRRIASDRAA